MQASGDTHSVPQYIDIPRVVGSWSCVGADGAWPLGAWGPLRAIVCATAATRHMPSWARPPRGWPALPRRERAGGSGANPEAPRQVPP